MTTGNPELCHSCEMWLHTFATSPLPLERALHEAGPLDAGALLGALPAELGLVLQLRDDMTQVKICLDKIS